MSSINAQSSTKLSPTSVSTQAASSLVCAASNETLVKNSKPSNHSVQAFDTGSLETKSMILWVLNMASNHNSLRNA